MARAIHRLSAVKVKALNKPGKYGDGQNLYLSIAPGGTKSWCFIYRWHGVQKERGLGSARDVSLSRARELAAAARSKLAENVEPAIGKRSTPGSMTFGECADQLIETMRPQWRSEKHAKQWTMTLEEYAKPLRRLPVDAINTEAVLAVLKPLWNDRRETADRLRSRIERVLDSAKAAGMRQGENPARWRGHLDHLLPRRQRIAQPHHQAMGYADLPGFMVSLRALDLVAARALEFAILTAARTGEVLGARWDEVDLKVNVWTIPASRMKAGVEHVVPLSSRAIEIINDMAAVRTGEFIFPGRFADAGLSDSQLGHLMRRQLKIEGATVHGFRSAFRDWCGDQTQFPREVAEAALSHAIGNATEEAYRRATALEKRSKLMQAWCDFCGRVTENVIQLHKLVSY